MTEISSMEVIDHTGLEKAQKRLLPKDLDARGSEIQREFLGIIADAPDTFCQTVLGWGINPGSPPKVLPIPLTESEFCTPTWETEKIIAATWDDLPANMAARPGTWTRIHVELVKKGCIHSSFLASKVGKQESGRSRINRVLRTGSSRNIDQCVRTIFRHMGGVIRDRGARTTYQDCPLAKAWWRYRYTSEAHKMFGNIPMKDLSAALRVSGPWEVLIQAMVSRLTVIGDQNIRPALICQLTTALDRLREKQKFLSLVNAVGRRSVTQALGALPPEQVLETIKDEIMLDV